MAQTSADLPDSTSYQGGHLYSQQHDHRLVRSRSVSVVLTPHTYIHQVIVIVQAQTYTQDISQHRSTFLKWTSLPQLSSLLVPSPCSHDITKQFRALQPFSTSHLPIHINTWQRGIVSDNDRPNSPTSPGSPGSSHHKHRQPCVMERSPPRDIRKDWCRRLRPEAWFPTSGTKH